MEQQGNIVELIDENNDIMSFEHIMTLDYGESEYIILMPLDQQDKQDEDEVVILKVKQDDNGEDIYVNIDDEDELDEVFDAFQQVIEETEK